MLGVIGGLIAVMASGIAITFFSAILIGGLAGPLIFFAINLIEAKFSRQDLQIIITFLMSEYGGRWQLQYLLRQIVCNLITQKSFNFLFNCSVFSS